MAQPSRWSSPGYFPSALIRIPRNISLSAFYGPDEKLSCRETVLKQSFWSLNARYGKLGENTTKEILTLRKQLTEAENGQDIARNAAAAEVQQLREQCEKLMSTLEERESGVQNERRQKKQYQNAYRKSGEDHSREMDHQERHLLNQHAIALESNERFARRSEREACEKAQLELVTNLKSKHANELETLDKSARAQEREICEKEHEAMLRRSIQAFATECEKRDHAVRAKEREVCEKERDAIIDQIKRKHATEMEACERSTRAVQKEIYEKERNATIGQLKENHATEMEAREQSARTQERKVCEEERNAEIVQLQKQQEAEILACRKDHNAEIVKLKKQLEAELLACRNEYVAKISHNDKAYEAKLLELKTERANSLRDRNAKNTMIQHHQEEKKLWQNNVDKLEQEHHQKLCGLREEYEHKLADLEAEKQQLEKQHGDRVQKILSQVEEHKAKATAVQKSYDKALEDLQSAKTEIERQVGITRDSEMKIKALEQHQSQILSQLGLSRDSETKNKTLEQHHSQILSQLGAKHTAETLRLREEADALRSELRNLRLKLAYNAQIIEDFKTNEGVLWEKLALQTAENLSLKVQSDELEKELAGKDAVNTQLQSPAIATLSSQHDVETICSQQEVSSQQETEKEEHAKISAEEVVAQENTVDGPKEVLLLNPNVKLGVAKQAETLDEAQSQIRELLSRLSDSQKKINTLQEQQDVLVQHNLHNWIAETTMAQARPSSPVPSCEGAIPVSLPLDTEEANKQEQVLQQIIKEYTTLEEECQREEAALGTSKAKLRTLNAKLRALEKEHADEFTWKAARRR